MVNLSLIRPGSQFSEMAISVFHSGVVWVTDTHTEARPPRSPPHEADSMALEEQLKGARLTRKGDPSTLHPI